MFCSNKDNIQFQQKANVVYRITCPGCYTKYIGKTDRNILTRKDEHRTADVSTPHKFCSICRIFKILCTSLYRWC